MWLSFVTECSFSLLANYQTGGHGLTCSTRHSVLIVAFCHCARVRCSDDEGTRLVFAWSFHTSKGTIMHTSLTLTSSTFPHAWQVCTCKKYVVSTNSQGSILIKGSSLSALASGLHRYLTDIVHVDIYWFIGSRLDTVSYLPRPVDTITGRSIVPWRYYFNTGETRFDYCSGKAIVAPDY